MYNNLFQDYTPSNLDWTSSTTSSIRSWRRKSIILIWLKTKWGSSLIGSFRYTKWRDSIWSIKTWSTSSPLKRYSTSFPHSMERRLSPNRLYATSSLPKRKCMSINWIDWRMRSRIDSSSSFKIQERTISIFSKCTQEPRLPIFTNSSNIIAASI